MRRRRTRAACRSCRVQKLRCSGTDPCQRCQARGEPCAWDRIGSKPARQEVETAIDTSRESEGSVASSVTILDKNSVRQHILSYFEKANSSSCVFLHKPTVLADWSRDKLCPIITAMVCSLSLRLTDASPEVEDTSRAWAGEAQSALLSQLGTYSIRRLQAMTLLLEYRFLVGDTAEAWNLISLAARMAFTLRLNYEHPDLDPITQESQRRLVWRIYQLDQTFCGGIEDLAVCPIQRVHVRLPCDDHSFNRGLPSKAAFLGDAADADHNAMDMLAYNIRLKAIRDKVLRWVLPNN